MQKEEGVPSICHGIKPRVNESSQAPVHEGFESHKRTEHL